ncbi:hypothetical protein BCR42DRAFT_405449 [Absidia repens]|uniref:Zn(2)-C6 fungal-type domain-containing protein n=1 Tax=Absidia repens TaxID=90262 RepID=A0A1X2ITI1_9FUNG|nr:hypothetical protein BCR42DRAFT_405449 [Absidia repens]
MDSSIGKAQRKVSCLSCRSKKVKCDGGQPCSRCVKKDCGDQCTYAKQRPLGRPAKNAVVNKLVLSRTRQHSSTSVGGTCRDFIIENLAYTIPAGNKFLHNDKTKNLLYFIETYFTDIFKEAVTQLALVRATSNSYSITSADVKMYDLLETHNWTASEVVNIFISKSSSLPLDEAHDYNSVASALFQEVAFKFFDEPPMEPPLINPLITLPTQQAVRLIECFFCIHPHSVMFNKTLFLQGFWTDSVDPLLLCAVYGTTTYFARMLEGKPVHLWEAADRQQRNPFLDYAYYLLQKSSSAATLVKYQAVILLGIFEGLYGYPKRGMAMLGLAYMIGGQLGVMDGTLLSTEVSDVEAELLSYAYWTSFNNTIRGSLDVGHAAHFTSDIIAPPLPPPNIEKSLSYQLDKSSGNQRLFRSYYYLVETFYVACVHSKFMNKFLQCFPEVKYNLTCNGQQTKSRPKVGYPTVDGLVERLNAVLEEFDAFIHANRHEWTTQQAFTIEMSWRLLEIHLIFIMDFSPPKEGNSYTNSAFDIFRPTFLSETDVKTMARVQLATPKIYAMMDALQVFLADSQNYKNNSALLPRTLIVSILETATTVLCLKHRSDTNQQQQQMHGMVWDYLNKLSALAKDSMWTNWSTIQSVRNRIEYYHEQVAKMEAKASGGAGVVSPMAAADAQLPSTTMLPTPKIYSVEDDLALAAFLDPCSPWLAPMANILPLDKLLCGNPIYDSNPFITTSANDVGGISTISEISSSLPLFDGADLMAAAPSINNNILANQTLDLNDIPSTSSPFTATTSTPTPTLTYTNDTGIDVLHHGHPPHPQQPFQLLSHIPPLESSSTTPFIQNILFNDDAFL